MDNRDAKLRGLGGAPTRATTLPTESKERKKFPVASGFMDYFPDAIVAVANVSYIGNKQHNPGRPLHWARNKSIDEADTMMRHFLQRGTLDVDGVRHSAKMVWRALALLQKEIEQEQEQEWLEQEWLEQQERLEQKQATGAGEKVDAAPPAQPDCAGTAQKVMAQRRVFTAPNDQF